MIPKLKTRWLLGAVPTAFAGLAIGMIAAGNTTNDSVDRPIIGVWSNDGEPTNSARGGATPSGKAKRNVIPAPAVDREVEAITAEYRDVDQVDAKYVRTEYGEAEDENILNSVFSDIRQPRNQIEQVQYQAPQGSAPMYVESVAQAGGTSVGCSTCGAAGTCVSCVKKRGGLFRGNRKEEECFQPTGYGCDRCPCPCPPEETLAYYRCNFWGHYPTLWRSWPENFLAHRPVQPVTPYDRFRVPAKSKVDDTEDDEMDEDDEVRKLRDRLNAKPAEKKSSTAPARSKSDRPAPELLDEKKVAPKKAATKTGRESLDQPNRQIQRVSNPGGIAPQ